MLGMPCVEPCLAESILLFATEMAEVRPRGCCFMLRDGVAYQESKNIKRLVRCVLRE
jgi:hypothetical protein